MTFSTVVETAVFDRMDSACLKVAPGKASTCNPSRWKGGILARLESPNTSHFSLA